MCQFYLSQARDTVEAHFVRSEILFGYKILGSFYHPFNEINVTLVHVTQIDYFLLWEDQIVVAGLWETVCSERCNGIIIWSLSSE